MNPIVKGWYADPEVRYYNGKYWVYVTQSFTRYKKQLNIGAFSTTGNWMNGTYRVLYSVADNPYGPFNDYNCILSSDKKLAKGPGHHGWVKKHNSDEYYIFYHRRNIGDFMPGHRILCKDIWNLMIMTL